jgi:hypothetical protein
MAKTASKRSSNRSRNNSSNKSRSNSSNKSKKLYRTTKRKTLRKKDNVYTKIVDVDKKPLNPGSKLYNQLKSYSYNGKKYNVFKIAKYYGRLMADDDNVNSKGQRYIVLTSLDDDNFNNGFSEHVEDVIDMYLHDKLPYEEDLHHKKLAKLSRRRAKRPVSPQV